MKIPKFGSITGYEIEPERKPLGLTGENKAHMTDLIIKSPVKDPLKEYNLAPEFYEMLNDEVNALLEEAAHRGGGQRPQTV